jgi:hypothetical protein
LLFFVNQPFADNWGCFFLFLLFFFIFFSLMWVSHFSAIVWLQQEQRSLKAGDVTQQESRTTAAASMKLTTDNFSAEKVSFHLSSYAILLLQCKQDFLFLLSSYLPLLPGCHGHSTAEANGNFVWSIQSRTSRSGHFSVQIDYQRQIRPQRIVGRFLVSGETIGCDCCWAFFWRGVLSVFQSFGIDNK